MRVNKFLRTPSIKLGAGIGEVGVAYVMMCPPASKKIGEKSGEVGERELTNAN